MLCALEANAAPPANDECSGAEVIDMTGPFPWLSSITTNMHEATTNSDPPQPLDCYGGAITKSVWYQFSPPESGLYTVSLKFTATTMGDTMMGIYTSPGGCAGPFTQFACNDDTGDLQSAILTNFNAATTYYVVIWHTLTSDLEPENRQLQLKVTPVLPAANDFCESAEVIPSTGFPRWSGIHNTHLASTNNDPPGPFCDTNSTPQRSVWFKFRPATGGNYIIATCTNTTATKVYNTMLAVYQSTDGGCGTLNFLQCNPGFCGASAGVIINLFPETDYYIAVWELASIIDPTPSPDETDVQLIVDQLGPPIITTVGHTNVTPTGVTLLAAANPKGALTRGHFEWGTTPSYGTVTTNSTLGTDIVPYAFSRTVDAAPGMTVYYRAVVWNIFGTVYSEGKSVTLPFPPPDITSVAMQTNGLRIQFTGTEGYTHEVQVSEDLQDWRRLGDAEPLGLDEFEYVDPEALNRPQRFYRIKL